jgi:hypothetical protein
MIRRLSVLAVMAMLLPLSTASAQSAVGGRAYVTFGSVWQSASATFDAVAGTSRISSVGGGGTVTGIWKGLFVDVGVSRQKISGERVFVLDGTAFPLGIPLEITLRPVDIAAGWRWSSGRVSPYVGGGATFLSYTETADFAQPGEDVSEQTSGLVILGGFDVAIARWLHAGAEVRYRSITGVLGSGGVSEAFGEDNLGGAAAAVRVSVGL